MRNFLHFLLGSVRIRVVGRFPERFLNLCGGANLQFWDVKQPDGETLLACIPAYRLKRARTLAAQGMCELEVLEQDGLPFFLYRFRSRYALLAGLLFTLFGAIVLSQFILVVDVTGNESVPDSVILTELEMQGLGPGTYGPGVDRRTLANEVLLRLPQLSFLSVNISGVYAQVVVREAAPEPELEDRWAAADIVAAADGVVVDVDPLIGQAAVEEGQAVLKGEVLISGTEEQQSGDGSGTVLSTTQVRAEGKVWAHTSRTLRCATPLETGAKVPTGEKKSLFALRIFKKAVKFYPDSSFFTWKCDKITETHALTLPGGGALPLAWERQRLEAFETKPAKLQRSSAEAFLKERLEQRLTELMGGDGQVLSRKVAFSEHNGVLTGTMDAACLENIGVVQSREGKAPPQS